MRSLIALVAVVAAICSCSAPAASIPSAASGVYVGSDRVCRVELARYQSLWIKLDLVCIEFGGRMTYAAPVLYAPNQCWDSSVSVAFSGHAWNEFVALRLYSESSNTLAVVIGPDITQVANGIGRTETWARVGTVTSPAPYTCGSTSTSNKPRG